jgi:hypothetical protein
MPSAMVVSQALSTAPGLKPHASAPLKTAKIGTPKNVEQAGVFLPWRGDQFQGGHPVYGRAIAKANCGLRVLARIGPASSPYRLPNFLHGPSELCLGNK